MIENVENRNIKAIKKLASPTRLQRSIRVSDKAYNKIAITRALIRRIIRKENSKFLVIVGPCSVRLYDEAYSYAKRLAELQKKVENKMLLVMRVFPEKPRTTIGWKGLIYDPFMNGTGNISRGLLATRKMMAAIAELGVPIATEVLDPFTIAYFSDCVSWGAIGARTVESQISRQLGSLLSMPIGFKNNTDGSLAVAVEGMKSAMYPHHSLGISSDGRVSEIHSLGNQAVHLILRGGKNGPNFDEDSVGRALELLSSSRLLQSVVIDCAHGNSEKSHKKQPIVFRSAMRQRAAGNKNIIGAMLESNLFEGRQDIPLDLKGFDPKKLKYGVSVTDECMSWKTTEALILEAANKL